MALPETSNLLTEGSTELLSDSFCGGSQNAFCGRKVSRCDCISIQTVYTVAAVLGVALLLIGLIGLAGHCAPPTSPGLASPLLQKLNAGLTFVATKLGTDPLILVAFPTAFGAALTLTGVVGFALHKRAQTLAAPTV